MATTLNFNPSEWGGKSTSKDYELFMEGTTPISDPISLLGHALTSPSQELTDPVDMPIVRKIGGRIVNRSLRLRKGQQTAMTFTLLFGNTLWTPALQIAKNEGLCETDFYAVRLCPDNSEYKHAYVFPNAVLNPPAPVNDLITIEDDVMAEWQTEMRVENQLTLWELGGSVQAVGTSALYDVAFMTTACATCSDTKNSTVIAVGGTDTAGKMIVYKSTDRFATSTKVLVTAAPNDIVGTSVWTNEDVVLIGFADNIAPATAASGGTLISVDGGVTYTLDNNLTLPVHSVTKFGGTYLAFGGATTVGKVWSSADGVTWTDITTATITAGAAALLSVAVDEVNNALYVVGQNGKAFRGTISAGSLVFTLLTPTNAGSTVLQDVIVLAEDHIAIAGASGYYVESFDRGVTWTQPSLGGSTAIYALAGDAYRTMAGQGSAFYDRSVLTKFRYSTKALQSGNSISGAIRGGAKATDIDGFNFFIFVTAAGETIMFKPFYPNA